MSGIIEGVMRANKFRQMPDGAWERQVTSLRTLADYRVRVIDTPDGPHEAQLTVLDSNGKVVSTVSNTREEMYSSAVGIAHQIAQ